MILSNVYGVVDFEKIERNYRIHRYQESHRPMMIQDVFIWAVGAGLFTWFSVKALVRGEIGTKADGTAVTLISEVESPAGFWAAVIFLLVIAIVGWSLFTWQGIRYLKQRRKIQLRSKQSANDQI